MQLDTLTTVNLAGFHKQALLRYLLPLTVLNARNSCKNYAYQF
jgi:hypothetical protein